MSTVPRTVTMQVSCPYCSAPPLTPCKCPSTGRITELLAHPSRADRAGIQPPRRRLKSLRETPNG